MLCLSPINIGSVSKLQGYDPLSLIGREIPFLVG